MTLSFALQRTQTLPGNITPQLQLTQVIRKTLIRKTPFFGRGISNFPPPASTEHITKVMDT